MQSSALFHAKAFLIFAGLFGCEAILFGAWSSHGLSGQEQEWAEIAIRYQSLHILALLILGLTFLVTHRSNIQLGRLLKISGYLWLVGILLFSGSLSIMAAFSFTNLGFLTPIGGITLASGWLVIAISAIKLK
ncbi:DUF423 domain-containing protein [Curvivirga aplysinae]|uniref:DUF423 domain-containing protein n=1 Tax=Curvivirga aplysinae TaxID=2529852 RepID=UPI0012BBC6B6|nr:DUF423 domain-containing protein [Curvivirga aplysinae]MTI09298.1 DUF423 domain-containing protein [Curvivirga aplysinae]